jgi:hypothetical protein
MTTDIPSPAGILTDEEAASIRAAGGASAAPPELQSFFEAQLNQYDAFRVSAPRQVDLEQRTRQDQLLEDLTLDFDKTTAGQDLASIRLAPDDETRSRAKQSVTVDTYIKARTGPLAFTYKGVSREKIRDAVAVSTFGEGKGVGSDEAFMTEAKAWQTKRRSFRVQSEAVQQSGIEDALTMEPEDFIARASRLTDIYGSDTKLGPEEGRKLRETYLVARQQAEGQVAGLRPVATQIYGMLSKGKVARFGEEAQQGIEGAIDMLAALPEDERGYVVAMLKKQAAPTSTDNGTEKTAEAAIRSLTGMLRGFADNKERADIGRFQQRLDGEMLIPTGQTMQQVFELQSGMIAPDVAGKLMFGTRPATAAEKEELRAISDKAMVRNAVAGQAVGILEGNISPIKAAGVGQEIGIGVGGSIGAMAPMALSYVGGFIAQGGYADAEFQRQVGLGVKPDVAHKASQITGAVQAAWERAAFLFNFVPKSTLGQLSSKLAFTTPALVAGKTGMAFGIAGKMATVQLAEYSEEIAQAAAPMFTAALAGPLGLDLPQQAQFTAELERFQAEGEFGGLWRPDVYAVVAALTFLPAGVRGVVETQQARELMIAKLADPDWAKAMGIKPEQAIIIAAMPAEERLGAYQESFPTRDASTPVAKAAAESVAAKAQQQAEWEQTQVAEAEAIGIRIRRTDAGTFEVQDATTGSTLSVATAGEAATTMRQVMLERGLLKEEAYLDALDKHIEMMKPGRTIRLTNETSDLLKELEKATAAGYEMDVVRIWERADQYRLSLGKEVLERDRLNPDSRNALAEMEVFGTSVTAVREGVARSLSLVLAKGDSLDLLEEQVENDYREAVLSGKISKDTMKAIIKRIETATGDKYLFVDSDLGVTEAWSSIVRLYASGTKNSKGNAITKGARADTLANLRAQRRRLRKAETDGVTPGAFEKVKEYYDHLRAQLGQMVRLMKARDAGQLDDLETMIRESVGLKEQDTYDGQLTKEMEATEATIKPPDSQADSVTSSMSVGSRAQPADSQESSYSIRVNPETVAQPPSGITASEANGLPVWNIPEEKGKSLPKNSIDSKKGRQAFFARLDGALDYIRQSPEQIATPEGWVKFLQMAGISGQVPMPPSGIGLLLSDPVAYVAMLNGGYHGKLTVPDTQSSARSGLDGTVEMKEIIKNKGGRPAPWAVALHHFWGILSRMLPPIQQEALWLRLISQRPVLDAIQSSLDGTFKMSVKEWEGVVQEGRAQTPGAGLLGNAGTSNANSFHLMLSRWNGKWDEVAAIYTEENAAKMGRKFWELGYGPVGIKNKVQRFIGLTFGVPGVIMDRWKFVEMWLPTLMEAQGAGSPSAYFAYGQSTPEDPVGVYGGYGTVEGNYTPLSLAIYEGFEVAMQEAINRSPELKQALGKHDNPGGLHWHGWNAIKNEAVGHSSLDLTKDLMRAHGQEITAQKVHDMLQGKEYYTEGADTQTSNAKVILRNGIITAERTSVARGLQPGPAGILGRGNEADAQGIGRRGKGKAAADGGGARKVGPPDQGLQGSMAVGPQRGVPAVSSTEARIAELQQAIDAKYESGKLRGVLDMEDELETLLEQASSNQQGMEADAEEDVDRGSPDAASFLIDALARWNREDAGAYSTFGAFARRLTGDNEYVIDQGATDAEIEEAARDATAEYERRRTAMRNVRMMGITDVVKAIRDGNTETPLRAVNAVIEDATELRERVRAAAERRAQPRQTGKAAILDQIVRGMKSGKLDAPAGKAIIEFVNGLADATVEGTAVSMRSGKGVSSFDFGESLATLFYNQSNDAAQTAIHEFWHGLSRFLPTEEVDKMRADYQAALAKYLVMNPGVFALVGRYALLPEQFEDYSRLATPAELAQLQGYNARGAKVENFSPDADHYKISFTKENYRYVMLDEWIAETMTDRVMDNQPVPEGFMGQMVAIFRKFWSTLKAAMGRDPYERFRQAVMGPDVRQVMWRDTPVEEARALWQSDKVPTPFNQRFSSMSVGPRRMDADVELQEKGRARLEQTQRNRQTAGDNFAELAPSIIALGNTNLKQAIMTDRMRELEDKIRGGTITRQLFKQVFRPEYTRTAADWTDEDKAAVNQALAPFIATLEFEDSTKPASKSWRDTEENRINGTNAETSAVSMSIGPRAKLDAVQARLDARLEKDPAARRKIAAEAARRLRKLETDWTTERLTWNGKIDAIDEPRTRKSLDKEQAMRQAQFGKEAADEWRTGIDAKQKKDYSPRASLLRDMRTLDAIVGALPPEIRYQVGGQIKLAGLATDEARADEIARRIDRIAPLLERHLQKEFTASLEKLLERAAAQNAKPGEKMTGKLGPEVQHLMDAVRKAYKLTAAQTEDALAALDSRLADPDITPEQQALAERERELVNLVGGWRPEYTDSGRLDKLGRPIFARVSEGASAAQMEAAYAAVEETYETGFQAWQAKTLAKRLARQAIRDSLMVDTGKTGAAPERDAKTIAELGWTAKLKNMFMSLSSFEEMLRYTFGMDSVQAIRLADQEREAAYAYEDAVQAMGELVHAHFTSIGGDSLAGEKIRYALSQKDKTVGERTLSEMEIMQAALMWQQKDGQRHMLGKLDESNMPIGTWHYDQAWMDEAMSKLSPEGLSTLAFIRGVYAAEYGPLNAMYRARHGVDLPQNANYAPVTVAPAQAKAGEMIDPVGGGTTTGSILTPGSLRTRSRTAIAEPDFKDALQVMLAHTKQMEHWKAYYDFAVEAQAVLGNRELGNAVQSRAGAQGKLVLSKWIDVFAQGGTRDAGAGLAMNVELGSATGRAARMALVGRVGTLMIQSTQLGAAIAEMPSGAYLLRLGKLTSGQLGWKAAMGSSYIQRRMLQAPPIVQQALAGLSSDNPSVVKHTVQRLGTLISGADALFTAGTYAMILDYQMGEAAKLNLTGPAADAYAHKAAERSVERVAQPTRTGTRSLYENTATNPLAKLGWAFASEARQKIALAAWAAGNVKTDPARAARVAMVVWGVGGLMAAVLRNAWRDLRDDDDDEVLDDKHWKLSELVASTIAGPLTGIPAIGEALQSAIAVVTGGWDSSGNLFSGFGKGVGAAGDLLSGEFLEADEPVEDVMKDAEAVLMMMGLVHENLASASSLMHVVRDGAAVVDGLYDTDKERLMKDAANQRKLEAKQDKAAKAAETKALTEEQQEALEEEAKNQRKAKKQAAREEAAAKWRAANP